MSIVCADATLIGEVHIGSGKWLSQLVFERSFRCLRSSAISNWLNGKFRSALKILQLSSYVDVTLFLPLLFHYLTN